MLDDRIGYELLLHSYFNAIVIGGLPVSTVNASVDIDVNIHRIFLAYPS